MTINIKEVVITMTDAQKRTFKDDRQNLVNLAKALQDAELVKKTASSAFNEALKEAYDTYKEYGVEKDMLKVYANLKASQPDAGVESVVEEFNNKIEMLQFLDDSLED